MKTPTGKKSKIYVNGEDIVRTYNSGKTEKLFVYRFFKFGSNNIAFYSNTLKDPPDNFNINNVDGQYCFYRILDKELLVEIYDLHLKTFKIKYATIYEDRIHFYKEQLQTIGKGKENLSKDFSKSILKFTRPLVWPE